MDDSPPPICYDVLAWLSEQPHSRDKLCRASEGLLADILKQFGEQTQNALFALDNCGLIELRGPIELGQDARWEDADDEIVGFGKWHQRLGVVDRPSSWKGKLKRLKQELQELAQDGGSAQQRSLWSVSPAIRLTHKGADVLARYRLEHPDKLVQTVGEGDNWESGIPTLDKDSADWIPNKAAAKTEGLEVRSLSTYRKKSQAIRVNADKTCGIDKDGRMWRRAGTDDSHPWYYKPSLKNSG